MLTGPYDGDPSMGLPFDDGTRDEWCGTAAGQLALPRLEDEEMRFGSFSLDEDNHRGGVDTFRRNLLECPADPRPVYVLRLDVHTYMVYHYPYGGPEKKKKKKKKKKRDKEKDFDAMIGKSQYLF